MWYYLYAGFLLLGLSLFGVAIWQYKQTNKLLSIGVNTQATVIDLLESTNEDGDIMYKPVYQFKTREGTTLSFESKVSSRPASRKIGEKVKIIYDPNDHEEVKIVGFWGLYRWSILTLSFGAPLLIIGGGYLLYIRDML